jgi:hypothetical protein
VGSVAGIALVASATDLADPKPEGWKGFLKWIFFRIFFENIDI